MYFFFLGPFISSWKKWISEKTSHTRAPPQTNGKILNWWGKKLTIGSQDINRRPTWNGCYMTIWCYKPSKYGWFISALQTGKKIRLWASQVADLPRVAQVLSWVCLLSPLHGIWATTRQRTPESRGAIAASCRRSQPSGKHGLTGGFRHVWEKKRGCFIL